MKISARWIRATLVAAATTGLMVMTGTSAALAQSTPFLYQGKLSDTGVAANGNYDFQFKLFDTATVGTGTQQGSTVPVPNLTVANGLFTATLDFGSGTFPAANRFLEIGVKVAGGVSYTTLAPRQPILSTPYAIRSLGAGAADGLSVAGVNCVTSSQIAAGAVGPSQLATGAAAANLNNAGQTGVATGGVVLSATENPALVSAGYIRIGSTTMSDGWQQRVNGSAPSARDGHTAVWTGSEMIVWGGVNNGSYFNDGGRYNPASNTWTAVSATGAPSPRNMHTAVWTGTDMIVWGGNN